MLSYKNMETKRSFLFLLSSEMLRSCKDNLMGGEIIMSRKGKF
jgi:hypothetical protein